MIQIRRLFRRVLEGRPRAVALSTAMCLLGLSGCDLLTDDRRTPTTINLTPTALSFDAVGETTTLTAEVLDQDGAVMSETRVEWTSTNPDVADVSEAGVVTSEGNGNGSIEASAGSAGSETSVSVRQIPASMESAGGEDQEGTAGEILGDAVAFRVLDPRGRPAEGIRIDFEIEAGSGSVDPASVISGEDGVASTSWRLGEVAGEPQRLRASIAAEPGSGQEENSQDPAVTVEAQANPGPPDQILEVSGDRQAAQRLTALPQNPAVRVVDTLGNPVSDVLVDWSVLSGGGSATPASALTDGEGESATNWTLGQGLGLQTLEASVPNGPTPVLFEATALAVPSEIRILAGPAQTATVGEVLDISPTVRVLDASGLPVPLVQVTFTVEAGGGSLDDPAGAALGTAVPTGPSRISTSSVVVQTDASGIASAGPWTLGTVAGQNILSARVGELDPVFFQATGLPGPAAVLQKIAGDEQTGVAGATLGSPLLVRVIDVFGNPKAGATVRFQPAAGTASPMQAVSLGGGVASTHWTLPAESGEHLLTASLPNGSSVEFTATTGAAPEACEIGDGGGGTPGAYEIEMVCVTPLSPEVEQAFVNAAARWSQIIVGDQPDIAFSLDEGSCTSPQEVTRVFDDLYVIVRIEPNDGPQGILGAAGPCWIRNSNGLPFVGVIQLDEADVPQMLANGRLEEVIVHELGHVIGISVSIWGPLGLDLLRDPVNLVTPDVEDTHFDGSQAVLEFNAAGGASYGGAKVPVENDESSGAGTYNSHWRESVLQNELMTGFLSPGSNPLSRITAAALADMGYTVNMGATDSFTLPFGALRLFQEKEELFRIEEEMFGPIGAVDESGAVTPITPTGALAPRIPGGR